MNMNILVTGANGQLGREMRLIAQAPPYHFIFTDVVEAEGVETTLLDITSLEAVKQLVKAHDHQLHRQLCCLHQRRQGRIRRGLLPRTECRSSPELGRGHERSQRLAYPYLH